MKKKLSIVLLLSIIIFSTSISGLVYSEETHIITDCTGREVEVPVKIKRIGTLFAVSGHIIAMLGRGEDIVAVNRGLKRDILLTDMYPNIINAVMPKSGGKINIEELAKAKPDVIFISKEIGTNDREKAKINKFKIPYIIVNFNNISEQQKTIKMIAKVIGREEEADHYNKYYNKVINMVSDRVSGIPTEERVTVFHSIKEAARTDPAGTLPADWINVAGAINVSTGKDLRLVEQTKYFASLEQILLWNPEVILVNEDDVDQYIMTSSQWAPLKAVKDKRVYMLPNGVSRWGHPNSLETPLAILWTANKLYPELFKDINMVKETREFYKKFFEFNISVEETKKVLKGKGMRKEKG